ncbi:capsule biosynthesis protein GfcC [Sphaerotilus hippei]|uniref:Capsule biosynthesis protein GfcC n=1 Tax=Sphaerotilus hippei TaxID=744406 RepID=A0A318HCQ9_9BURK|nr:capsule biosynthesis protein GfcC [Sphaerotilus hippei]
MAACLSCLMGPGVAQAQSDDGGASVTSGPIRLRQSQSQQANQTTRSDDRQDLGEERSEGDAADERRSSSRSTTSVVSAAPAPAPLDEFERYVATLNVSANSSAPVSAPPPPVRRFGSDLFTGRNNYDAAENNALVPADYVVGPGDELQISLWGSVDADLRTMVDRSGRISIPRVGTIMVAGTRYAELPDLISRRVSQSFRNFQLSVSLGQVRSVRIYITGYVKRPGAYTVSSLSSVAGALMRSGGPTSAGSMRRIDLRRGKDTVTRYDLYDLLLKGDRSADRIVQAGDVIHVGPIGPQVALIGSVNKPAIFELGEGEKVADLVNMAGGFTAVADRSRLAIERLNDRARTRITQLNLPDDQNQQPASGDVLRAFSAVDSMQPLARQNKRVRIEGEVAKPGEYVLPPGVSTRAAIDMAGGYTPNAYIYGTEFNRESVRVVQQQNYERALRDMETEFTRATATQRAINADEAAAFEQRSAATARLIENLRKVRPTGRVVLQLNPGASDIPDLPLEEGDRIYVPTRPTTVGVFGSVFNAGAFLLEPGATIGDFLSQAGGPTRGADAGSTFVLRPNGSVLSQLQKSTFFGMVGGINGAAAEPGDTVFVPELMNKTTWVQDLKEWTQIMYQFGLGAAALTTLKN